MNRTTSFLMAGAAILGLASFSTIATASLANSATLSTALMTFQGQGCSGGSTGIVELSVSGKTGDNFTIELKCGQTVVTECTATVGEDRQSDQCRNTGKISNNSTRNCPVTAGPGNSKLASVLATSCY